MNMTFDTRDNILIIGIDGELVARNAELLKQQIAERKDRIGNSILNLTGMTYVDSSGLGVLSYLLSVVTDNDAKLVIYGLQPKPRTVFDITRVSRIFKIYDTMEEALKSFSA